MKLMQPTNLMELMEPMQLIQPTKLMELIQPMEPRTTRAGAEHRFDRLHRLINACSALALVLYWG